jgi:hypothetical protein
VIEPVEICCPWFPDHKRAEDAGTPQRLKSGRSPVIRHCAPKGVPFSGSSWTWVDWATLAVLVSQEDKHALSLWAQRARHQLRAATLTGCWVARSGAPREGGTRAPARDGARRRRSPAPARATRRARPPRRARRRRLPRANPTGVTSAVDRQAPSTSAAAVRTSCEHKPDHGRPRAGHASPPDPPGLRGFRVRAGPRGPALPSSEPEW